MSHHEENARQRAARDMRERFTSSIRVYLWLGVLGALGAGITALLSAGHHGASLALISASIGLIVVVFGFFATFAYFCLMAPARQRDEARTDYQSSYGETSWSSRHTASM